MILSCNFTPGHFVLSSSVMSVFSRFSGLPLQPENTQIADWVDYKLITGVNVSVNKSVNSCLSEMN